MPDNKRRVEKIGGKMMKLKRLSLEDKEAVKTVFTGVFTKEPWNDDWSDKNQLDMYLSLIHI